MDSAGIRRPASMFKVALGRTSDANERRAVKILETMAIQNGMRDPVEITPKWSDLVLTILFNHVKMDSTDDSRILGKYSMEALIQGLHRVYDKAGHERQWTVLPNGTATGNPTRGNINLSRFRLPHRSKLAEFGRTTCRAIPLNEELVADHSKQIVSEIPAEYDHTDGPRVEDYDLRRCALHAIWVVGMHCGLRFDELSKLEVKGISMGRRCCMTLAVKTKNSDKFKSYKIAAMPNVVLRHGTPRTPNWPLFRGLSIEDLAPDS
jgi:hypothetical protein